MVRVVSEGSRSSKVGRFVVAPVRGEAIIPVRVRGCMSCRWLATVVGRRSSEGGTRAKDFSVVVPIRVAPTTASLSSIGRAHVDGLIKDRVGNMLSRGGYAGLMIGGGQSDFENWKIARFHTVHSLASCCSHGRHCAAQP